MTTNALAKSLSLPARRSGRPSRKAAGDLTHRVLDAATALFLRSGFDATSMEAIAAAAGVAKRTVYSRFATKAQVFDAVIHRVVERNLGPLEGAPALEGLLEERLSQLVCHLLEWILTPEIIALDRITTSEVERFPELARTVFEGPVARSVRLVEDVLKDAVGRGEAEIEDIAFAAQQLMQAATGPAFYLAVHGLEAADFTEAKRERAERSIRLFLRGCRPAPRTP
ncbi:TetR/AcrR family transcriptional regulator [Chelatococcus reniformis]|uniref:TetR/AcrR family transcriptional regulator n=1 Tax=Chelatococcus reniformis TaxID=1494448 RepID=UPI0016641247|nr:TetR/AcrR family transcriptional regulator [Chelatococcus reniformis]